MGRREHAPWPGAVSPSSGPPRASDGPRLSSHTDAVECYVTAVPVLIWGPQTCAPCLKRVIMYAASPLVRFFSLVGSESTFEESWNSCTCSDLLTYPHLLATNNFWAGLAGPCRHFAVRDNLQSGFSKDSPSHK